MSEAQKRERFESLVLVHLDAAYTFARWLVRDSHDAEDVVQNACVKAYMYFDGFHGSDARPWFLKSVRNACYTLFETRKARISEEPLGEACEALVSDIKSSEQTLIERAHAHDLHQALEALSAEFREVFILREVEDLSYKEIAEITGLSMGTVMSRLNRARQKLYHQLTQKKENL